MTAARFKWQILASHDADGAVPEWTNNGMPECPHDGGCPHYDGKRCQLMGRRPALICEPVVERMADQLTEAAEPTPSIAGPDRRARVLALGLLAAVAALVWAAALGGGR